MRSHAKASSAGSTKRLGRGSKPALLLCVLAASVAALALVVGSASGATTRFLVEAFGSSTQPSFPADRGMAYDQGVDHLYVIDSTADTLQRFNSDGTAADFGALGSNAIDGEGTGDETPLGHLAFEANRQREQVALDESGEATDGNVYVTQSAKDVIDIFNAEGEYLGALSESTEGGAFGEPCGVAVDDEGTVYVGDRGDDRIHVFDPAAAVPVNGDSAATSFATLTDPCTMAAGDAATDGFLFVATSTGAALSKLDAATGEVKYAITTGASTVSVDPATGHVFVARNTGTSSQVDEFDASGASEATLVSSFKPGQTVEGIALNSAAEQVYVARASTENVEVFGPAAVIPDVVTSPPSSNTGVRATLAGTVNPDGVELDECFFEWGKATGQFGEGIAEHTAPCAESPVEIGAGTSPVAVHADLNGLQPNGTGYDFRLAATNPNGTVTGSTLKFTTPDTVITQAASAVTDTEATLNGTINPDGTGIVECVFEWGPLKDPLELIQSYSEASSCVPGPGGIGSGTSPVAVSAVLSGLHPGTAYAYRLKVSNVNGPVAGKSQIVQAAGPVATAWSEDVTRTDATLKAAINPEGSATTYHFEYGEGEAYDEQTPELAVGSDSSTHEVSNFLTGLRPGTTYHYRAIVTSSAGINEGPDLAFSTYENVVSTTDCTNTDFRVATGANLPNCRAYEMVSPVDKNGGDIATSCSSLCYRTELNQASLNGQKITYSSYRSFADALGSAYSNQYIATRNSGGWESHAISPAHERTIYSPTYNAYQIDLQFKAFSPDLSQAWLQDDAEPPLSTDAVSGLWNLYRRDNSTDSYDALTRTAPSVSNGQQKYGLEFSMATPDGSHAVFAAAGALTPDANPGANQQLYEFSDGELSLVSVLPDGSASPELSYLGEESLSDKRDGSYDNALSSDGSRIFWKSKGRIYVRVDGEETIEVGSGTYYTASTDGATVFYGVYDQAGRENLYAFDVDTEAQTLIAQRASGIVGVSDDGKYVYFVSDAALTPDATAGERNLYLDHEGTKSLVATISPVDVGEGELQPDGIVSGYNIILRGVSHQAARVSPDGRHLAFQSVRSLTGYDNRDAVNGQRDIEIYWYSVEDEKLVCASCRPSGARPVAQPLRQPYKVGDLLEGSPTKRRFAAAWLTTTVNPRYSPRALLDDGSRLFFNSFDPLVPHDTNGEQDVYQWEAQGSGNCEKADGCISLLSSGQSPAKSEFVDASADGADVFFTTSASLVPQDPGLIDIYDARIGGGFPTPTPETPCIGDACQSPGPAPVDPTPASALLRGPGDPRPVRARNCGGPAKRAASLSRRAKRLRVKAKRTSARKRAKVMRLRSVRLARKAQGLSKRASRCRRGGRRATR